MMEICRWISLIYPDYCYFFSSWNIEPFWRYQSFSSRDEDVHVHSLHIYEKSIKRRKIINEMGGNILGVNFLGGDFLGGNFPKGSFPRTIFNTNIGGITSYKKCKYS